MKKIIYAALAFAPVMALAQTQPNITGISNLVTSIGQIIQKIIPIMFAIAIIYFFWGLIQYIRSAGDPKKAAEGRGIMIYGVLALAVMVSVYGLIGWLQGAVGLTPSTTISLPEVQLK